MLTPEIQTAINAINMHIGVLNDDFTKMSVDVAIMRTNIDWLMKTYWVLLSSSLSALVLIIINLVKRK